MSASLLKLTGKTMRNLLATITSNPFRGVLAGFLVTGLVQSSSAVTVMLVSFVNAGLVSFTASLGIIFGANIGTTVTAWIISLLGFGDVFDINSYILPIIAVTLPLFFSGKENLKTWSEFIFGFTILFLGIGFIKSTIPPLDPSSPLFQNLQNISGNHFINVLLFCLSGLVITVIFQSSSATVASTMVLANQGWIPLDYALAMVLGENVGTTATANLAAIIANRSGKRTAFAHFMFNALGLIWALVFFGFFSGFIHFITNQIQQIAGGESTGAIPIGISVFHSLFNIINTFIFLLFLPQFDRLCRNIIPEKATTELPYKFRLIDHKILSTSELLILQARKEVALMAKRIVQLFEMIPDLMNEKNEIKFRKKFERLEKAEDFVDQMESEIAGFLTQISQEDLSEPVSKRVTAMLRIIDDLKNIGNGCFQMGVIILKKNEGKVWFTQDLRERLENVFQLINTALFVMKTNLEKDYHTIHLHEAKTIEEEINSLRNELKQLSLEDIKSEKYPYQTSVYYNELLSISEKIGDFAFGVNTTIQYTTYHKKERIKNHQF